jgi:hypothetical protein
LTVDQVLAWCDSHHTRTGQWPGTQSGRVREDREETWFNLNQALRLGLRGLPRGLTLVRLLQQARGVRNRNRPPPVTEEQIVAWAVAHHDRTGAWPHNKSGPVVGVPWENWNNLERALISGRRGLPGGNSLAKLLADHFAKRNHKKLPPLSVAQILRWADAHRTQTGQWLTAEAGAIPDSGGETWSAVDNALRQGLRGLPAGDSLYRLLWRSRRAR